MQDVCRLVILSISSADRAVVRPSSRCREPMAEPGSHRGGLQDNLWVVDDVVILPSALKRGYGEEDISHALRNAIEVFPDQGDHHLTVAVGPATTGVLLEVGYDRDEDGRYVVVHVMERRSKYDRTRTRKR